MSHESWTQRMEDGGFSIISNRRGGGGKRTPRQTVAPAKAQPTPPSAGGAPSFRYQQRPQQQPRTPTDAQLRKRVESAMSDVKASPLYEGLTKMKSLRSVSSHCVPRRRQLFQQLQRALPARAELLLRDELLAVDVSESAPRADDDSAEDDCCDHDHHHGHGHEHRSAPKSDPGLHVFDPVLDPIELRCIRGFGGRIRPRNEEGRISLAGGCLYIALHCPRQLYSNLLDANWGADRLTDVFLLGNSFAALADAMPSSSGDGLGASNDASGGGGSGGAGSGGWCRVTRVAPIVSEVTCAALAGSTQSAELASFDHAFASSSLHHFEAPRLPPPDDPLWVRPFDASPEATGDRGLVPEVYLSTPPAQPSGAARAAAGSDDVGKGWLDDDGDKGAQYHRWLCVSFPPDADLGRRLLASSAALPRTTSAAASPWSGRVAAAAHVARACRTCSPRRRSRRGRLGAARRRPPWARRTRSARTRSSGVRTSCAGRSARARTGTSRSSRRTRRRRRARGRRRGWRLAPVADVASQVAALEATIARRAAVSLHAPRRRRARPRLFSPLWALVKEVDAIVDGLAEGAAASTGLGRRQHWRVQPLILLVTDDPAIEARLRRGMGVTGDHHAGRAAPEESVGGGGGAGGGAAAATADGRA